MERRLAGLAPIADLNESMERRLAFLAPTDAL